MVNDPDSVANDRLTPGAAPPAPIGADEFASAYSESLARTLDLATWQPGEDIAELYQRFHPRASAPNGVTTTQAASRCAQGGGTMVQHETLASRLPGEILGLLNRVILRRPFGSVDEGLWTRLSGLAPGQAIVALASLSRPLLVAIDPTPCKLRLVE